MIRLHARHTGGPAVQMLLSFSPFQKVADNHSPAIQPKPFIHNNLGRLPQQFRTPIPTSHYIPEDLSGSPVLTFSAGFCPFPSHLPSTI